MGDLSTTTKTMATKALTGSPWMVSSKRRPLGSNGLLALRLLVAIPEPQAAAVGCGKYGGNLAFLYRYHLVNIQKAIENGHRNSEFSHQQWWFSMAMLNNQMMVDPSSINGPCSSIFQIYAACYPREFMLDLFRSTMMRGDVRGTWPRRHDDLDCPRMESHGTFNGEDEALTTKNIGWNRFPYSQTNPYSIFLICEKNHQKSPWFRVLEPWSSQLCKTATQQEGEFMGRNV